MCTVRLPPGVNQIAVKYIIKFIITIIIITTTIIIITTIIKVITTTIIIITINITTIIIIIIIIIKNNALHVEQVNGRSETERKPVKTRSLCNPRNVGVLQREVKSGVVLRQPEPTAKGHRPDGLEVKVRFYLYLLLCRLMKRGAVRAGERRDSSKQALLTSILDADERASSNTNILVLCEEVAGVAGYGGAHSGYGQ
jgi:hypothetical protein